VTNESVWTIFVDYIRFFAKKILKLICSIRLNLIPGSATAYDVAKLQQSSTLVLRTSFNTSMPCGLSTVRWNRKRWYSTFIVCMQSKGFKIPYGQLANGDVLNWK
jgi:hypothetical protein